ncbi:MAG: GIY-YIG nuclease family protein [Kiritimatiellae bacterium]|nr:GIY-YIG nuclease family protein [Kiritimatiellia bacterium]
MKYVYLIQSVKYQGRRYVGVTDDIERRLAEHNGGKSPHTTKYRPWVLKVIMGFDDESKANAFERYLKSGSGHAFSARHLW